ncbi:MAG: VWA domain-containing protein, partial [Anaerolineales bacterium]|nr:VWA domain-containing protein [Anaerolineales bacterium]
FTEDIALFADQIAELTAVGGGDYPEALNEGFYQAVTNLAWRSEATKLLLILGDAPPEANNTNTPSYEETSRIAAEQNITIFTFGSDGLNTEGAFIFEQIALSGNGRFYFITDNPENSHGGATAVYVTNQLPALLLEVVQEMLNEQVP